MPFDFIEHRYREMQRELMGIMRMPDNYDYDRDLYDMLYPLFSACIVEETEKLLAKQRVVAGSSFITNKEK